MGWVQHCVCIVGYIVLASVYPYIKPGLKQTFYMYLVCTLCVLCTVHGSIVELKPTLTSLPFHSFYLYTNHAASDYMYIAKPLSILGLYMYSKERLMIH